MRVVLDTSVFVAGILNPNGGSGELLRLWREDALFEVIASNQVFEELYETLRKPRLQGRFSVGEPEKAVSSLRNMAEFWADDKQPPNVTRDVNHDYLVSLSISSGADALVSLDQDLLVLQRLNSIDGKTIPVLKPGDLLSWLRDARLL